MQCVCVLECRRQEWRGGRCRGRIPRLGVFASVMCDWAGRIWDVSARVMMCDGRRQDSSDH